MISHDCGCVVTVAFASLIFLLVVGCGRTGSSDAASPVTDRQTPNARIHARLDACALLSKEEAEQVLGESIGPPTNQVVSEGGSDRAAISQCRYQGASSPGKTLAVFVRRSPVADNSPESVRDTLTQSGLTPEDLSGIGDQALWAADQLHVFAKDNLYLIVSVNGLTDARQQATSIAQRVLKRV